MLKAVIFDLGGVLVDNPAPGMFDHYSKTLNIPKEDLLKVYSKYKTDWQKGVITEDEFWTKVTSDLNATKAELESLWLDGFLGAYKEKAEMFSLIKDLKKNGYKVALLSNTETPVMNHIKKQSWPDFDLFVYSCEVGMRKPDLEIYESTLLGLNVKPEEAVFIDDRQDNVEAAKELGINSFVFENPQQVIDSLQQLDISLN